MSRTVIDLDDELVADVAKALGTNTKKETVNTALREVVENRRRALAVARLGPWPATARSIWSCSRTR
ncbi:type II toxin-antitoxin system VapB family antitoxin [Streptomyces sp. MBT53]|nr:type II toxin-antitoxin system VapB family antitoxin [Streptomyces sp. MBT53]